MQTAFDSVVSNDTGFSKGRQLSNNSLKMEAGARNQHPVWFSPRASELFDNQKSDSEASSILSF